jgi:hypothetical protein
VTWSDDDSDRLLDSFDDQPGTAMELDPTELLHISAISRADAQHLCDAIRARAAQRAIPIFAWVQDEPGAPKIVVQHEPMAAG